MEVLMGRLFEKKEVGGSSDFVAEGSFGLNGFVTDSLPGLRGGW